MAAQHDVESQGPAAADHKCDDANALPPVLSDDGSAVDIEKLGRRRPDSFSSGWVEVGFCVSVLGSMMLAEFLVSGFNGAYMDKVLRVTSELSSSPWLYYKPYPEPN